MQPYHIYLHIIYRVSTANNVAFTSAKDVSIHLKLHPATFSLNNKKKHHKLSFFNFVPELHFSSLKLHTDNIIHTKKDYLLC